MFIMITDFGLSILAPQLPYLFIFIFYYWQVLSKTYCCGRFKRAHK